MIWRSKLAPPQSRGESRLRFAGCLKTIAFQQDLALEPMQLGLPEAGARSGHFTDGFGNREKR